MRLASYVSLARHWFSLLAGTSYWHGPQGLGTHFKPGVVNGYFNDLTLKTTWSGATDAAGIPLNVGKDGNLFYFPTTIIQKGLGHWDMHLAPGPDSIRHLEAFRGVCRWTLDSQDGNGGWPVWPPLGLEYESKYSAMTQGEAISLLIRADALWPSESFLEAAERAYVLMMKDIHDGGTSRLTEGGAIVLEEVPSTPPSTVLNGWIFALFGGHELALYTGNRATRKEMSSAVAELVDRLDQYDIGYWSRYDRVGNIASPFYHALHIAQLTALALTFDEHRDAIMQMQTKLKGYSRSPINRTRAVLLKVFQKLLSPPKAVLR